MNWKKHGLIFEPKNQFDWINAYAAVPTVEHMFDNTFKVYFGSRTINNFSQTGYFTGTLVEDKFTVHEISSKPILKLGPLGSFDDSMALASCIVENDGRKYMYYTAWMQGKRTRYYPSLGLAISKDGGSTWQKHSKVPMVAKTNEDPYGQAAPYVILDNGTWRMWYSSYRRWEIRNNEPWPQYEMRYAESTDGINWQLLNKTCIGGENEEAVAIPCVIKLNSKYLMWYSYRNQNDKYLIGYAESNDGTNWDRMDNKVGIGLSKEGWDSEMIEYPHIIKHQNKWYMFYNGNTHGKTGIGLASINSLQY